MPTDLPLHTLYAPGWPRSSASQYAPHDVADVGEVAPYVRLPVTISTSRSFRFLGLRIWRAKLATT